MTNPGDAFGQMMKQNIQVRLDLPGIKLAPLLILVVTFTFQLNSNCTAVVLV